MTVLRTAHPRRRALGFGVAIAVAATVLGCSPTPEPDPTPTSAFASEEEAFAAAEETYRAYIRAYNAVDYGDPSTFDPLASFTTGDYNADEREGLSEMHAEGNSRSGAVNIEWFRGVSVGNDGSIHARTCNDVSDTAVLDSDGNSLVSPDRPTHYALDLIFVVGESTVLLSESEAVEDRECSA